MTRWDYKLFDTTVNPDGEFGDEPIDRKSWLVFLRDLGAEGWEAVSPVILHGVREQDSKFLLLKRPRQ